MDLGLSSGESILRRHIADRAVQSNRVVVIHVDLNQAARIVQRQRGQGPDSDKIDVLPGSYRVWIYYGNLTGDDLNGKDHYKVVLWNVEPWPVVVLKQARNLRKIDNADFEL